MRLAAAVLGMLVVWPLPSLGSGQTSSSPPGERMVVVPAGSYLPHYARGRQRVELGSFALDRHPVTRAEYAAFLDARPTWRRSAVKPLFAGSGYLAGWRGDLDYGGAAAAELPVTEVSWFAAKSYCEWRGARLPTIDEWEYVASASETERDASGQPAFIQRLLDLNTSRRGGPAPIGSGFRNAYGIHDLHGLIWEWVLDFNNIPIAEDSRTGGPHDAQLYCAAGGIQATDPTNYPAFLRYAMRGALDGRSTVGNLGFRCARSR
jgi:formylglycine-generating enzyme